MSVQADSVAPKTTVANCGCDCKTAPKYPGISLTTNGNQLVSYYTEARIADAGVFYPITPSTEMGENFQLSFAKGELNVFGGVKIAIETEGEHAAQGGAIACSVTGKRVANFTSGQGLLYGLEQYYAAPGKLSTMTVEVAARALTKHALNVHCGHDDIYAAFDTGWNICFGMDAQQAADQAVIIRKVNELSLTPGINGQDGFLTSHLERTFKMHEADLLREYLGRPDDIIECPTDAQKTLFGETRRRVPECIDLKNPVLLGSVQNQEHYMGGVASRRHHFAEHILGFFEEAYEEFGQLTGRYYGLVTEYNNDDTETTIVALGSAAENARAAVDYLKETRGEHVGVVHINVLRPFPEKAVINALAGKKQIIILERTDDHMSGDGPLARDIRTALSKAVENNRTNTHTNLPTITPEQLPRIFSGVYGLGSRDFRPEGILGAYEYATGKIARQDGKTAADGESFFYVGINHPYNVESNDRPSLLPGGAIAIRFHSIGGWGMITTGKNLSEMFGEMGSYIAKRDFPDTPNIENMHVSANPKYGSEKKGAPTNYFLVVAPERIHVNCDLQHVNVVLCCDPKVFLHTNPLVGLEHGGAFVWESNETDDAKVWERIPAKYRKELIDKEIRLFVLDGFKVAREATSRPDLQYRMQGNSFLGAFFKVSTFLNDNRVPEDEFLRIVEAQYNKKFGRFGKKVVASNMTVMQAGFENVREVARGTIDAIDTSSMRGDRLIPMTIDTDKTAGCAAYDGSEKVNAAKDAGLHVERPTIAQRESYDSEFRSDYGYHQPSTPHAATGAIAAATGNTTSKYVARRKVPIWHPEKCTQCMACITSCPDTALPNTAQDICRVLDTALYSYVGSGTVRDRIKAFLPEIEQTVRARMNEEVAAKTATPVPFKTLATEAFDALVVKDEWFASQNGNASDGVDQFRTILQSIPWAYSHVPAIFKVKEKKDSGSGGLFGIFVSDRCKGCGECVVECGDHEALEMVDETEYVEGYHTTGIAFLDQLPNTQSKYLGKFDPEKPGDAKSAALQFHLMVRDNYESLVSGDGACAGCGEKTVLRAIATLTEAYLRPLYHAKADRLLTLVEDIQTNGLAKLQKIKAESETHYEYVKRGIIHVIMGYGGENDKDTDTRIANEFTGSDEDILDALTQVMKQDAFNHQDLQAVDGGLENGMSVMAMTASTGCNTVYSSTHPSNPHPYPWMNSLFQDGATIGWLLAESFIVDHARRSVLPERLARSIVDEKGIDKDTYFRFTHFNDIFMTDAEVDELPRVWAIGGDGAFGDIGFQNVSKAVLQNRPNLGILMLDTQVYSNTGGQNSDSSPMPGGFDMNQFGKGCQGKMTEMKSVAEAFTSGHGSPFVAQVSMANSGNMFGAILNAITYRGTGYIQAYTACQPEHGVPDDHSTVAAKWVRDSRGLAEFVFNPSNGESYDECVSLKGNPDIDKDWWTKRTKVAGKFKYTVANWAATEPRFRQHIFKVDPDKLESMIPLEEMLLRITQQDIVHRCFIDPNHRSYLPDNSVYAMIEQPDGTLGPIGVSRHMVLFCVERRKAWRMLQSKAGITNLERIAQKRVLNEYDNGTIPTEIFNDNLVALVEATVAAEKIGDKKTPVIDLL